MCIIVDADVARKVFVLTADEDFGLVRHRILNGKLTIVHGGKLTQEYIRMREVARVVVDLDRAGLAVRVNPQKIDAEVAAIGGACTSNDAHIIALARASGARVLCSHDRDLHEDFGNEALISPKGRI